MEEFTSCPKCDHETTDLTAGFCALCGGKMLSSLKIRKLGWMSVVAGGFLVAIITATILWLRFSDARFEGTAELARYAIIMAVLIAALGVVGISAGVWQIKHGKRNKALTYTLLGLGWALLTMIGIHKLSRGTLP